MILRVTTDLWTAAHAFEALLKPLTLLGIDDMGKFGANGSAVRLP